MGISREENQTFEEEEEEERNYYMEKQQEVTEYIMYDKLYIVDCTNDIRTCVNHKEPVFNRHIPVNMNLKLNT